MTFSQWIKEMGNKRLLLVVVGPTLWFLGSIGRSAAVYETVVICATVVIIAYFAQSAVKCVYAIKGSTPQQIEKAAK